MQSSIVASRTSAIRGPPVIRGVVGDLTSFLLVVLVDRVSSLVPDLIGQAINDHSHDAHDSKANENDHVQHKLLQVG